ncbi:MAG: nitroreductase family protein, partial [Victivallales bacterium]
DAGAAIQSMEFAAWERGIGCCWIGSHKREKVADVLGLEHPDRILYLVALGYPAESPVCEDVEDGAVTNYYLDDKNTLHVPKLTVDAITKWC